MARFRVLAPAAAGLAALVVACVPPGHVNKASEAPAPPAIAVTTDAEGWQTGFALEQRTLVPTGRSEFFVLEPGHQIVLASDDEKVTITVLEQTKEIAGVTTRVVEEREEEDGELHEISYNYFAMDQDRGDVFYFGEEVDIYADGKVVHHEGAWLAGENGAMAGMMVPGKPEAGQKYFMEQSPGRAMDRAEVASVTESLATPAGDFTGCLKTIEGNPLKPRERDIKVYAPGIGLIQDEDLLLVGWTKAKE
ncbi:hypothetical protein HZA57_07285 [Candidatus Poribacteria bacterium]|nr:hypothetical protein [Candidatus Poribacteria bacterium]